ncbi:FecR family protein [Flavitalea sp.]|nr:FecR domain-containing protein [Flavitalea sp.]
MQNESQFDELIIRFLSDETTTEEDKTIINWINDNSENRAYFEQLQSAWILVSAREIIAGTDVDAGWLLLRAKIKQEPAAVDFYAGPKVDGSDKKEDEVNGRKSSLYRILVASVVAASLIGIIVVAYFWEGNGIRNTGDLTRDKPATLDVLASVLRHEENTSGQTKQLALPDGSTVLLSNNSALEFQEPFINNKREFTLVGKAEFAVTKDTSKAFIVYSDQLSTTALGTRFSVASYKASENITIQLFEGKVVIQSTNTAAKKMQKAYYLSPGEELVYRKGGITASVRKISEKKQTTTAPIQQLPFDDPSIPRTGEGSWYMFNNQSLPQVFARLEKLYNVKISFSKADISNLYFIGRFNNADSLEKILREIAEINDLKVTKRESSFIIEK